MDTENPFLNQVTPINFTTPFKGTVSVISGDPTCIDEKACFTKGCCPQKLCLIKYELDLPFTIFNRCSLQKQLVYFNW